LAAESSDNYPRIAGLILTGNQEPAPQVHKLLQGVKPMRLPILYSSHDTFTTALKVNNVEGRILPSDERKIAVALGMMESYVNMHQLRDLIAQNHAQRVTPLMFEYELIQRAKSQIKHIVLPEGDDERILRAAEILSLRNVVKLSILGDEEQVRAKAAHLGLKLRNIEIINPSTSPLRREFAETYTELRKHKCMTLKAACDIMTDVSYFGTMMVQLGYADGMVSGAAHTTQHTIRPAFEIIKTKPGCNLVSSVFFMCLEDKVLVYGDCAVNPNPSAEELADIAVTSSDTARMFGVEPRTALLSYSSGESGKGTDVERVRAATKIAQSRRPDLKIDGPIQYDAAVDTAVGRSKMPNSEVAGKATVLIFPDLNTGNNTYKAVQRSANAVAVGPVLQGLNKPVNDLSRGCTVADIVNTVVITAIQAQEATA
jgi:phosphate acetyltransferase